MALGSRQNPKPRTSGRGGGGVTGQTPENVISPGRNPEAVGGGGYRGPWKSVLGLAVVDLAGKIPIVKREQTAGARELRPTTANHGQPRLANHGQPRPGRSVRGRGGGGLPTAGNEYGRLSVVLGIDGFPKEA